MAVTISCRLRDVGEISRFLAALQSVNESQMRGASRSFPALDLSGVRYQREPARREQWLSATYLLARGVGDCEDLSAYQAAWLVVRGIDKRAQAVCRRVRSGLVHCYVVRGDGKIDDPSKRLGMGGAA